MVDYYEIPYYITIKKSIREELKNFDCYINAHDLYEIDSKYIQKMVI